MTWPRWENSIKSESSRNRMDGRGMDSYGSEWEKMAEVLKMVMKI